MELNVLSDSSANNEFEKALINGYIEMAEINLLIARESFYAESEAYRGCIADLRLPAPANISRIE